ncbi:late embryogenesis abundant protein Lea14-A-like [Mangifera indica]|uniref:late embryogenesis abundant protein Lea14-A-like n=1 Tax=Mangifera indica TaxID=29780 RepID=UPI001CFBA97B|nr:late embryogenesis abundant protein Lea14-A-like [Mangifera indica]
MSKLVENAKNYVSEKVANMKKPEASLTGLGLHDVSREGVEYDAKVSVDNPYKHPIPICEISYILKSDGRVILTGKMPDPGSLKANGKTMLNVPLKVPHSVLASLVRDIARDWDIDYELELGLTIDLPVIGDFTIPLSNKGEIKLPTLKDFFK